MNMANLETLSDATLERATGGLTITFTPGELALADSTLTALQPTLQALGPLLEGVGSVLSQLGPALAGVF